MVQDSVVPVLAVLAVLTRFTNETSASQLLTRVSLGARPVFARRALFLINVNPFQDNFVSIERWIRLRRLR